MARLSKQARIRRVSPRKTRRELRSYQEGLRQKNQGERVPVPLREHVNVSPDGGMFIPLIRSVHKGVSK